MEITETGTTETACEMVETESQPCEAGTRETADHQVNNPMDADRRLLRDTIENIPPFDVQIGQQHPLRILLAEDSLVNLKIALWFLKKLGYRADVAFNGIEALDALRRQSYDVILMDAEMPEMDGREATMAIRKIFTADQQPHIIAMSASNSQSDLENFHSIGMNDYIAKPLTLEGMVHALLSSPVLPGKITEVPEQRNTEEYIFSRVA